MNGTKDDKCDKQSNSLLNQERSEARVCVGLTPNGLVSVDPLFRKLSIQDFSHILNETLFSIRSQNQESRNSEIGCASLAATKYLVAILESGEH